MCKPGMPSMRRSSSTSTGTLVFKHMREIRENSGKNLNAVLVRDGKHADQTSTVTAEVLSTFFMRKVSDVRAATEGSASPTYTEHDG